jgi:hypothetical protein
MNTGTPDVVNHRGVRMPASGRFPHPFRSVPLRRLVQCVFANAATVTSTKKCLCRETQKKGGGVATAASSSFTFPRGLSWL